MELTEWLMTFFVYDTPSGTFRDDDAQGLWNMVVGWAERRKYGVGGSYRSEGSSFVYRFGVCATRDDQLIDEAEMIELWACVCGWLGDRGVAKGGYRPFTDDESDSTDLDQTIDRIRRSLN